MEAVEIHIKGKLLFFTKLNLIQMMGELHSFTFNCQIESPNGVNLKTYIDFYDDILQAPIEIKVAQKTIFEGVVAAAECVNQYQYYVDFKISGRCKMFLIDYEQQCRIFNKKSLSDIFKALVGPQPANIKPTYTEPLHFTVQYNLTAFRMMQLLCRREGEWLYYDGSQIQIKRPDGQPIKLNQSNNEVFDLRLNVKVPSQSAKLSSYDILNASKIAGTAEQKAADKQTLRGLVQSKQQQVSDSNAFNSEAAPYDDILKRCEDLYNAKWFSGTVILTGKTSNPSLGLGVIIEFDDSTGQQGIYIITKITHYSDDGSHYYNEFEAVLESNKYPPYTDPDIAISSGLQYATIAQNEDGDGLGRVKVKFTWSGEEESCWMNVISPHAGKGRGFRFLPEIDDTVIVGFYYDNMEFPYLIGSVYNLEAKDGVPEKGNHIKTIGTKTNRRLEFDENRGLLFLTDFYGDDKAGNSVFLEKSDDQQCVHIYSREDDENNSRVQVDKRAGIDIMISDGNKDTVQIRLNRDGQNIHIFAKKAITIHSENNVNVNAGNISINGDQSITMKTKKFELKSDEVVVDATVEIAMVAGSKVGVSATQTQINGDGSLSLSGGGKAELKGGVVMIN